jgi:hypothetical protein
MSNFDLAKIVFEAENGPVGDQLMGAPILDVWYLILTPDHFIRARGAVVGHPGIDDPYITTSPVIGFDVENRWMRTRSRFYRLGHDLNVGPEMSVVGALSHEYAQRYLAEARKLLMQDISVH